MGRSSRLIPGFDYRVGKPTERTLDDWRQDLEAIIRKGGRREIVEGETWGILPHAQGGLQFEIYENIKLKETT